MKKIVAIITLALIPLYAGFYTLKLYQSQYKTISVPKNIKEIHIGERDIVNIKVLSNNTKKIFVFGKDLGRTSMIVVYRDGSFDVYNLAVIKDIQSLRQIIHSLDKHISLSLQQNGDLLITGHYSSLTKKNIIQKIIKQFGFDSNQTIDIAQTHSYERLIKARLYAIEIDEQKAKDIRMNLQLARDKNIKAFFNILPASPTFAGSLLSAGYQKLTNSNLLDIAIKFLVQHGVAKIVNDTMVTIKEDQNGTIFVGGEVYIPTQITYDTNGRPTIGTESKEYGLQLTVTPTLLEKDVINMHIEITASDFDLDPTHKIFLGTDLHGNPIYIPAFRTKRNITSVLAKNGQIIAVGGKLSSISKETLQKVPILGDLPLLGTLFRNKSSASQQKEIIFFIIPYIQKVQNIEDDQFLQDLNISIPSKKIFQSIETVNNVAKSNKTENLDKKITIIDQNEARPVEKNQTYLYKVSVYRCFVRNKQSNKIVDIWKKDHPFIGSVAEKNKITIVKNCDYENHCYDINDTWIISSKCIKRN